MPFVAKIIAAATAPAIKTIFTTISILTTHISISVRTFTGLLSSFSPVSYTLCLINMYLRSRPIKSQNSDVAKTIYGMKGKTT